MKINKYTLKIIILIILFFKFNINGYPQHCNLFEPYEWLFDQVRFNIFPLCDDFGLNFSIRYEGSFNTKAYLANNDNNCIKKIIYNSAFNKKTNSVQYLGEVENCFTSFFGNNENNQYSSFAQKYTTYNGFTANREVLFYGDLSISAANFSIEKWLSETVRLGFYIPYYFLNLRTLNNLIDSQKVLFEQTIENNILNIYKFYNDNIKPYKLFGFGDSSMLLSWQDNFFEKRDFLTGVLCSLRVGFNLPSGEKKDVSENSFLKIPLGYDASWGIVFGGSIEIDIGCYLGAGVSADCIKFFGKTTDRYIKTVIGQTSLLLLDKVMTYVDPGFKEQFTVLLNSHNFNKTIIGTFAYQYNKQNDSEIMVCSDKYSNLIANSMQILAPWTNHNCIFLLQGIIPVKNNTITAGAFVKLGFNGERCIVADTIGLQAEIMF